MIKKLKIKFILLSNSAVLIFLILIVSCMNFINYHNIIKDCDRTIEILLDSKGALPSFKVPPHMSPEVPYESRYFFFILDKDNNVIFSDISRIASIDFNESIKYKDKALTKNKNKDFINDYRYIIQENKDNNKLLLFLDCGRKLDSFESFLMTSCLISIIGFLITSIIILIISDKIVKPFSENYTKQKKFITNASHEIKTPLTIINANIDLLEMEYGSNDSLNDIQLQVVRLRELTDKLVSLSRIEENTDNLKMIESPISDIIVEVINNFKSLSLSSNKNINYNVEEMLTMICNDNAIRQMVSILIENAIKYSPNNSDINIEFYKQNSNLIFKISNISTYELNNKNIKNVFDRFYRLDSSRNSNTGGYGIGLSIVKAIVNSHSGKIFADVKDNNVFEITIYFHRK